MHAVTHPAILWLGSAMRRWTWDHRSPPMIGRVLLMAHFFKYLVGTEAGSDVHISKTTQRVPLKEPLKVGLYGGSNLIVEMNRLAGGTPDSAAGQPIYAKVEPADSATVTP